MRGRFITFEGGEGAGKSTQIAALEGFLLERGVEVVCTREPGGTPNAEQLRDLVVSGEPGRWSALEEMLIMYTARSELVRTRIKPALSQGKWVLSDRFADSTLAYQGYAGGVDIAMIQQLHHIVLGDFKPDLTLILDVQADAGMNRVQTRADEISRFEKHQAIFYKKVRNGYISIAKAEPDRCKVLDGNAAIAKVQRDVTAVVMAQFDARFWPKNND